MLKRGFFVLLVIFLSLSIIACQDIVARATADWPPLKDIEVNATQSPLPNHPPGIDVGVAHGKELWIHYDWHLYHSIDSGSHWSIIKTPDKTRAVGLQVSADNETIVLISSDGKLLRSLDAGDSWQTQDLKQKLAESASSSLVEEYGFGVSKAIISDDLRNIALLVSCQILISNDMAESWRNLAPPSSYKNSKRDYCAYDVILDDQFEPLYSLSEMTGSIATDEYVMIYQEQRWNELCTYGITGFLLKSVAKCGEVEQADQLNEFYLQSEIYKPELNDNFLEAVFSDHHYPMPKDINLLALEQGIQDRNIQRSWVISRSGVAVSDDHGKNWQTQAGGIADFSNIATLKDGVKIALYGGGLYVSQDEHVWERFKDYENIGDIHDVVGGALIANQGITLIRTMEDLDHKHKEKDIWAFSAGGKLIWAQDEDLFYVSDDDGETWLESKFGEPEISDWVCLDHCIGMDYYEARIKSVYLRGDTVEVEQGAVISQHQDFELEDFWHSSNIETLLVSGYRGDSEYSNYWVSNDGGRQWSLLPIENDYLAKVIFLKQNIVLAIGSSHIYRINAGTGELDRTFLLGDVYSDSLCVLAGDKVIMEVMGKHPDLDEEQPLLFYSEDRGHSWFTDKENLSLLDQCY